MRLGIDHLVIAVADPDASAAVLEGPPVDLVLFGVRWRRLAA